MVELDDLREALRAREPLAPQPEVVFAGADRRYRRVRARRRVTGAAAAVVVITAGLSVGLGLARQHGSAPAPPQVQPAAAPSDPLVVPASSPPFTIAKAYGAEPLGWSINEHDASVEYDWKGEEFTVTSSDSDPERGYETPATVVLVNGARASLRSVGSSLEQVSWPLAPGKWVAVTADSKTITPAQLQVFAAAVRLAQEPVPTLIHSLRVPAGLSVTSRRGTVSQDTVTLCPAGSATAGKALDCVVVTADREGPAQSEKRSAGTAPPSLGFDVVVEGISLRVSGDRRHVVRQLSGRSLEVQRIEGDPSILPGVAASVIMN